MPGRLQVVYGRSSDQSMHQMSHKTENIFETGVEDQMAEQGNGDFLQGWTRGGYVVCDRCPKEGVGDNSERREKTDFMLRGMVLDVETSQGNRGSSCCGLDEQAMGQKETKMEMPDPIANGLLGTKEPNVNDQKMQDLDVIVIEDDDAAEDYESCGDRDGCDTDSCIEGSSMEVPRFFIRKNGKESDAHLNTAACELSDSSDEEDCCVLEPGPSRRLWCSGRVESHRDKLFDFSGDMSSSNDSSDCEIVEDPCGMFRQSWEQAAFQKQVGNATKMGQYRADSEGSTSASNPATSTSLKQRKCKEQTGLSPGSQDEVKEQEELNDKTSSDIPVGSINLKFSNYRKEAVAYCDQQCDNHACSDLSPVCEANANEALPSEKLSTGLCSNANSLDDKPASMHHTFSAAFETSSGELEPIFCEVFEETQCQGDLVSCERFLNVELHGLTEAQGPLEAIPEIDLIGDRERLKQTAEFRHADEEEWTRRQMELQRQAQEAQRLRKRKKAEANRKMEMENRQRQRLEEIRQSQQKEEQNLDFKEQVRGRIRDELEQLAATCMDMATLLQRLGIEVDGGGSPSIQQVNAAYKRALLRFHPDRNMAMAKSDPLCQVEAEETFKLISRLKGTMQPVTNCYFP